MSKKKGRSTSSNRGCRRIHGVPLLAIALSWGAAVTPTRSALADNTGIPATANASPADSSLTFHGITLYGTVDLGLQYENRGAPISDYYVAGTASFVTKYSNGSVFGVTPSNIGQSKIGIQGIEPLVGDWSAVFRLETYFNPQSGEISDCLKALAQDNGRALSDYSTGLDSSIAGQTFQTSYVGLSSQTWGTVTFGRQTTLLAEGVAKYDPQMASLAFSLIGAQGIAAGGGGYARSPAQFIAEVFSAVRSISWRR